MREYIAYEGEEFVVEWYYDQHGESQSFNYYSTCSKAERIKILQLFKRMADVGEVKDKTKFNYEGDQIYAFKPQVNRFLCFFFRGKKIIVTNAYKKKQQKLPMSEKGRSLKCKTDYEYRIKEGHYYE